MKDDKEIHAEDASAELGNEAGAKAMDAALRSSFVILKGVIGVLVVYLLFSNAFVVEENSEGAILLRFGEVTTTEMDTVWNPGFRYALPYPIEEKVEIKRAQPVKTRKGWYAPGGRMEVGPDEEAPKPDAIQDGYVLTADEKVVHVKAEMQYRIQDPIRYAFEFHNAPDVLKMILDNAITSAAAQKTLAEIRQPAINNEKTFPELVEVRARELVEQYGLGVDVTGVTLAPLGDIELPHFVQKSDASLSSAKAKAQATIQDAENEAKAIRASIASESGELSSIRSKAEGDASRLQQSVTDLAERLQTIRTNYPERQERIQYMEELYLRTIMKIAQNKDVKIYLVSKGDGGSKRKLRLLINQPPPEPEEEKK